MANSKEITVLFQDCVLCGDKGRQKRLELESKGYIFRKISFVTEEGRELSARAVAAGVGSMPVFFYGDHIAGSLSKLLEMIKPRKKAVKKKSEEDDGVVPEA